MPSPRPEAAPRLAPALDIALGWLLDTTGARAVRVVDGRTGGVVGMAGHAVAGGGDDPATVAGLVRDAVALGQGGLDDVVVTTHRSMHVLRPTAVPGVFVHLQLGLDRADVVRARRALAAPTLDAAIRMALAPAPDPGAPDIRVPDPRSRAGSEGVRAGGGRPYSAVPAPRTDLRRPAQQPALAGLVAGRAPAGHGIRAAGVLAELIEVAPGGISLPRRRPAVAARPAGGVTVGLPEWAWARDEDTLRRLVLGLRRLS